KVNPLTGKVFKDNYEIFLSALEYRLLLIFFSYPNQLLTREFLLEEIWNITGEDVSDNTLSVYMKRIRNKIEDNPQNPNIIKTMRGLGYKLGD
ncbi:winged helix-turn-helix domain-containing protein, partial [Coprobacillus cateniformis]